MRGVSTLGKVRGSTPLRCFPGHESAQDQHSSLAANLHLQVLWWAQQHRVGRVGPLASQRRVPRILRQHRVLEGDWVVLHKGDAPLYLVVRHPGALGVGGVAVARIHVGRPRRGDERLQLLHAALALRLNSLLVLVQLVEGDDRIEHDSVEGAEHVGRPHVHELMALGVGDAAALEHSLGELERDIRQPQIVFEVEPLRRRQRFLRHVDEPLDD